jgi:dimeric dUTPase (all-alpha-NTP-PPase superfamily)
MNWDELYNMQAKLDQYIQKNHKLENVNLFEDKILALLVEFGELANETKSFKFWSNKPPSEQAIILEEYVDGLHFILSLGIGTNIKFHSAEKMDCDDSLTNMFNDVFEQVIKFRKTPTKEVYYQLFNMYLHIGQALGFSELDVQQAYYNKNKVNFERQDSNY